MDTDPSDEIEKLRKLADKLMPKYPEVSFKNFLEETPPDTTAYLVDLKKAPDSNYVETPDIVLYCTSDLCSGLRVFRCANDIAISTGWRHEFLAYSCRNCGTRVTRFAISFHVQTAPAKDSAGRAMCTKLGQVPAFGPQVPARLISLIGPDREIFLQGRRAENRGMGIGAFAYYRRVVENQKNRIIAEVAKVAKRLGSSKDTNELFVAAMAETQFSRSMEMVKDVIPQTLLISGRNPLTLMHTALSKGLHNPEMTDEHCLALAQSIRIVLGELAERASAALKDDKEIQSALGALMAIQSKMTTVPGIETTQSKEESQT